jgi:hypothetical protein
MPHFKLLSRLLRGMVWSTFVNDIDLNIMALKGKTIHWQFYGGFETRTKQRGREQGERGRKDWI